MSVRTKFCNSQYPGAMVKERVENRQHGAAMHLMFPLKVEKHVC